MSDIKRLEKPVYILSSASVAGHDEQKGPLGGKFDYNGSDDDTFGCKSWEKAESEMQRLALSLALSYGMQTDKGIDYLFAGDLLNQCIGSSYGLCSFDIPYFGLYGACSTAAEGIMLSALLCSSHAKRCAAVSSSHNASAERQYRFPLEYGGQRPPTAQWTVTGAGAFILTSEAEDVRRTAHAGRGHTPVVRDCLTGRVMDAGVDDANNMGAAMAPAAADTLIRYFSSSGTAPEDYDLILTGDLGYEGSGILCDIVKSRGYDISPVHSDCGLMIYDRVGQDKHAGGSGCGCSAAVLSASTLPAVRSGAVREVLFIGTGALMSPLSLQQNNSIPGIGHLVHIGGVSV